MNNNLRIPLMLLLLLLILPPAFAADSSIVVKVNKDFPGDFTNQGASSNNAYNIGIQKGTYVFELWGVSFPESATVKGNFPDGKCAPDADGYCNFEFTKFIEADFDGINGLKAFLTHSVDAVSDSFKIRKISIRREFFEKGLFIIKDSKLRFNTALVPEKDRAKFECYSAEGSEEKYCRLPFRDREVQKAARGFDYKDGEWEFFKGVKVEVESIEKQEILDIDRIEVLYAEKGERPITGTTIKVNGELLENISGKLKPIDILEFDFGGMIVPLRLWNDKKREVSNILATGIIIENANELSKPTIGDIAEKIYDITQDGAFSSNLPKVKWQFLKYLGTGYNRKKDGKVKFFAYVPASRKLEYGLRAKSADVILNPEESTTLGPKLSVAIEAEKVVRGKPSLLLNVEASLKFYSNMFKFGEELRQKGIGAPEELANLMRPEADTAPDFNTTILLEDKEYFYNGKGFKDKVKLDEEAEKLPNGEYTIKAEFGDASDEQHVLVSNRDGITQFSISSEIGAKPVKFEGTTPATLFTLKDMGTDLAIIQIDDEEGCVLGTGKCIYGTANTSNHTFFRLFGGNKFVMLVEKSPDVKHEVVLTIVPLDKVAVPAGVSSKSENGLIKNLRVDKAYSGLKPPEPKNYPIYAKNLKEGEVLEFTQELEKVIFNYDLDVGTQYMVFEVRHFSGVFLDNKGELVSQASYKQKTLTEIATQTELKTESWRGFYLAIDKEKGPVGVPEGFYLLILKICERSNDVCKEDKVTVKVNKHGVSATEPAKGEARILISYKGITNTVFLSGNQNEKRLTPKEPTDGYAKELIMAEVEEFGGTPINPETGVLVIAESGSLLHLVAAPEDLNPQVLDITLKPGLNQPYTFDFTVSDAPQPEANRNIRILGPVPEASKYSASAVGEGAKIDFPKLPTIPNKDIVLPLTGAGEGARLDVKITDIEEGDDIIYTSTLSKDVRIPFSDYKDNLGKNLFRVKIINVPESEDHIGEYSVIPMIDSFFYVPWSASNPEKMLHKSRFTPIGGIDKAAFSDLYGKTGSLSRGFTGNDDLVLLIFDWKGMVVYKHEFEINYPYEIVELNYKDFNFNGKYESADGKERPSPEDSEYRPITIRLHGAPKERLGIYAGSNKIGIAQPSGTAGVQYFTGVVTKDEQDKEGVVALTVKKLDEDGDPDETVMYSKSKSKEFDFYYDDIVDARNLPNFRVRLINVPENKKNILSVRPAIAGRVMDSSALTYLGGPDSASYTMIWTTAGGKKLEDGDDITVVFFEPGAKQVYSKDVELGYPNQIFEVDYKDILANEPNLPKFDDTKYMPITIRVNGAPKEKLAIYAGSNRLGYVEPSSTSKVQSLTGVVVKDEQDEDGAVALAVKKVKSDGDIGDTLMYSKSKSSDFVFYYDDAANKADLPNFRIRLINIPEDKKGILSVSPVISSLFPWSSGKTMASSKFTYVGGPNSAGYSTIYTKAEGDMLEDGDDILAVFFGPGAKQIFSTEFEIDDGHPSEIIEVDYKAKIGQTG